MFVAISILALGVVILVHEAGHFLVALACRMRVEVFSIGFGPAILAWHGKRTEYRLAALPLGGYVRIAGMAPGDGTPEDDPASFANRPAWQRFLVILAGPFINWMFAFLLLTVLYTVGFRVPTDRPVIEAVRGAPAVAAGLMPGDRILAIDDRPIASFGDVVRAVAARRGQPMQVRVERGGVEQTLTATTGPDGLLGIAGQTKIERYPLGASLGFALSKCGEILANTLDGLRQLLRGTGHADLMGPVGIVGQTVDAVSREFAALFYILVQISLVLAVMNLLPIPALDGGRLVFILIAMVRRRPVDPKLEAMIHGVGIVLLLGLLAYATYGDVSRRLHRSAAGGAGAAASAPADAGR
jgi:regulator of sigma E protease